jgi:hypothetical protein
MAFGTEQFSEQKNGTVHSILYVARRFWIFVLPDDGMSTSANDIHLVTTSSEGGISPRSLDMKRPANSQPENQNSFGGFHHFDRTCQILC